MLKTFRSVLFPFAGSLLLLIPALINGYPMIYSDTSTYLASGFELQPPMDRPMTYGLFMRLFSLNGLSLWPVILAQSFILSWLIWKLACLIPAANQKNPGAIYMITVTIASFSGAGWAACYLIPDIFTPIMLLSAILILLPSPGRRNTTTYYIIFGFSAAMHSSHIPFGIAFLSFVLIAGLPFRKDHRYFIRTRPVLVLTAITLFAILAMGSSLSKSKHVFLMGAFIEQGIIKPYLYEKCEAKQYKLCAYKDALPEYAWQFIWQETSPLYELGGWKETKEEFLEIIRGTYVTPRFFIMHVSASLQATVRQLARFQALNYHGVAPNASVLEARVETFVPGDHIAFNSSKQNLGELEQFKFLNTIQLTLVLASCLVLLLAFAFSNPASYPHVLVLTGIFLVLGILINAWVCGTFANSINRLGNRMIWLIPAYTLLLLYSLKKNQLKKTR